MTDPAPSTTATRWEYLFISTYLGQTGLTSDPPTPGATQDAWVEFQDKVVHAGEEGWEAVGTVVTHHGNGTASTNLPKLMFKRPARKS